MREFVPSYDKLSYYLLHFLSKGFILNLDLSIMLGGSDIYKRGVLDAILVGIEVKPPNCMLFRSMFDKPRIGIHMPFTSERDDLTFDVNNTLHHLPVELFGDQTSFSTGDRLVDDSDNHESMIG